MCTCYRPGLALEAKDTVTDATDSVCSGESQLSSPVHKSETLYTSMKYFQASEVTIFNGRNNDSVSLALVKVKL